MTKEGRACLIAYGRKIVLVPHEEYLKLGADSETRSFAYRELFKSHITVEDIHLVEGASDYSYPLDDDRFSQQIEQQYFIKLGQPGRGRPKKALKIG